MPIPSVHMSKMHIEDFLNDFYIIFNTTTVWKTRNETQHKWQLHPILPLCEKQPLITITKTATNDYVHHRLINN